MSMYDENLPEFKIDIVDEEVIKSEITDTILRSLPDWFGIESAIVDYVRNVKPMIFWKVTIGSQPVGLMAVKKHFDKSAEIFVMGIQKEFHRYGIGRRLVGEAEKFLKKQNVEFLQVKTLSPAHPDKNYALTRKFYLSLGFEPLEELKTLWGEHNPCLLMVKSLV